MYSSEPTFETNLMGETVVISKPELLERHLHGNRIRSLDKAFETMKLEFPEIVGGTVYGSMANGYVHDQSDVDMTIFIDVDVIGLAQQTYDRKIETGGLDTSCIKLKPFLNKVYSNYTSELIRKYLSIPKNVPLAHIKCLPISRSIVTEEILTLIEYERDILVQYEKENQNVELDSKILLSTLRLYNPADQIGQLFLLQIGGNGIDNYRETIIRLLSENEDVANQCWKVIRLTSLALRTKKEEDFPHRSIQQNCCT